MEMGLQNIKYKISRSSSDPKQHQTLNLTSKTYKIRYTKTLNKFEEKRVAWVQYA